MPHFVCDASTAAIAAHPGHLSDAEGDYIPLRVHALDLRLRSGVPVDVPQVSAGRFRQRTGWFGETIPIRELSMAEMRAYLSRPAQATPPVIIEKTVVVIPARPTLLKFNKTELMELAAGAGLTMPLDAERPDYVAALLKLRPAGDETEIPPPPEDEPSAAPAGA